MAEEEKHLSLQGIEQLIEARSVEQPEDAQPESVKEANRHLVKCERCRMVVSLVERWDRLPAEAADLRPADRTSACPADAALFELAAGVTRDHEAEELLEHVAECEHCGPFLRQSAALFSEELSPEEQSSIAGLATAKPDRQASIAFEISEAWRTTVVLGSPGISSSEEPSFSSWTKLLALPRLAWSAAVALVLTLAVAAIWQATRAPEVDSLLAQAYTERRTIELRFENARYSPPQRERAAASSAIDRPQALLDANALISRRLKTSPHDSQWLAAKARADLLEWNYQDAIDTLRRLQTENSNSRPLQRDLAMAYFERGEATAQPADYGTAAELLGEVLKLNPQDSIALFNRALVYERLLLYHEALEDWQRYLRLDDKSEWAVEARRHLKEIQEKLAASEGRRNGRLLSPREISLAVTEDENTWKPVEDRVEDYLKVALEDWLPHAFAGPSKDKQAEEVRSALFRLSRILAVRHGDRWLEDVLSTESQSSHAGIAALSQAMVLVDHGDYGGAGAAATSAQRYFNSDQNRALSARATLEHLIAIDRAFEGQTCQRLEATAERIVGQSAYVWIRIQLLLESAVCSASAGNLESAYNDSKRARDLAKSARFDSLYLRAQGFVAEYDTEPKRAFASNVEGLKLFWERSSDASRGHQFFEALAMLAENRANWQLATALNREAVLAIKTTSRRSVEATARLYLGRAEYRAGFSREATLEWQFALQTLASLPSDDALTAILTELHVNLAKAALDERRLDDASHELAAVAPRFSRPGLQEIAIQYFSALGRLHSLAGKKDQASKDWPEAIRRTEVEIRNATSAFDRIRLAELCSECFDRLARLQIERSDTTRAWGTLERYRNVGVRAEPSNPLDEASLIKQHLPDGAALLSTVELEDGPALWLVTRKEITFRRVPLAVPKFHETASRFISECSDRTSSLARVRADGAQLYRWLILPFAEQLSSVHFLVVERSQTSVSAIPFEALVDSNGHYLSERFPIAYTAGIAYLEPGYLSSKSLFLESALVVAGSSVSGAAGSGFPALPEAMNEVREVSALFRSAIILEGQQAKSSVLRREMARVAVFHFAGHAIASPGRSGLLVAAADGKESVAFWPEESSDHLRNLRLVFLSACATDTSSDNDSPDLSGLAQAYRLAGSRVVLGNKWNVDSSASRYFALSFYRELAAGSSIPAAAEQAGVELRKRSGFEHPFFWSAPSLFL